MGVPPASKAASFNSAVAELRAWKPERMDRVLAKLSAETAELVRNPALPVRWIDARHFAELVEVLENEAFDGDRALLTELAARAIRSSLTTFHKVFLRVLSPHYVIDRSAQIWSTYTRANGELSVEKQGANAVILRYTGIAYSSPAAWAYRVGASLGVLQAAGATGLEWRVLDGGGSGNDCTVAVSWR